MKQLPLVENCFHRPAEVLAACLVCLLPRGSVSAELGAETARSAAMAGFTSEHAAAEQALEQKFDAQLDAGEIKDWLQQMASAPNQVGSAHNKANADFMLARFREWGWDAQIETFQVLYPVLKSHSLELIAPTRFTARLTEPPVAGDRTSTQVAEEMPPYHAYGADGDVTAELVYVNRGMPEDYKELARHNVEVKGRIVIARYGGGWRGLKPKLAFEHGAIGCLIYSDPQDDGYGQGDDYPKGSWRPLDAVQRGSVEDLPVYPGDPLTPGVGATPEAKRLPISEATTIQKIPVLPISYGDAQPFLAALSGPVAPPSWRGALPITYHLGPGPARVHLSIASDWSLKPIYDVVARIPGRVNPDQWVIRGNHHDAWVFGAWDPLSGNSALMAEAKAIGQLVRNGWRPRRTLVYCSWDGEEPGLLGSTEWVETHAVELRKKAMLYVNSDGNGRGFLEAAGSQQLRQFVSQVAADVKDPETKVSVLARLRASVQVRAESRDADEGSKSDAKIVADGPGIPLGALGSGSDFTPFLQHLGIATLSLGFGGEAELDGIYHSAYDSYDHFSRFGDPGFVYSVALAQTTGRTALRAAEADVMPFRLTDFAQSIAHYVEELHKLVDALRDGAATRRRLLGENAYRLAADPTQSWAPPEALSDVPYLNLAPLDNAVSHLKESAQACDRLIEEALVRKISPPPAQLDEINAILVGLEQTLVDDRGLPGRDWYKHMIYAPGLHTGYGVKTLPAVREAIDERHWSEADEYAPRIAAALERFSHQVDRLREIVSGSLSH